MKTLLSLLRKNLPIVGVMLTVLLTSASALAANFYKYKDDSDSWVISHNIPAERVKFGYQVVDQRGRVLEVVERQLTPEEYKEKLRQEEALIACTQATARVRNLYQNDEDIDYAENQAVSQVETSISNLRANLTHIENQKKELEARAAQMDIAGQALPRLLLANIDQAQIEKRNLNEAITRKRIEKDQLTRDYAYDRSVFALTDCSNGLPEEPPFLAGQTE